MDTVRTILRLSVVAGLVAVTWTGCGRKDESEPAAAPQPAATAKSTDHSKVAPTPPVPAAKPVTPAKSVVVKPDVAPEAGDTPPTAVELEKHYLANPDFTERVQGIFQLSDLGTPEALSVLGRLFQKEQDPDLRIQVLNSLFDIEGQDDKKTALLAAGAATNQPKEVREAAIDALGDIEAKRALPILQALLNDPDEDLREHAKDVIEQLQSQEAMQK